MICRAEHPKPQFMRKNWKNLNGPWAFSQDPSTSGKARGLHLPDAEFNQTIQVPFCPESVLSGIGNVDFMPSVWYKRTVCIKKEQLKGRIHLHFGAVDYEATLYVNGQTAGFHRGGYGSFFFDITDYLQEGENVLTLHAVDPIKDFTAPKGKQSDRYESYGCLYTRTTGIWQTVWLEFLPNDHIRSVRYVTDAQNGILTITAKVQGSGSLTAEAFFSGEPMGKATVSTCGDTAILCLPLKEIHLWELGKGGLYDLHLTFGEDRVQSYFGLRTIGFDGYKFLLNGTSVFQRLVLDQGFYPDGIYTAPSEEALIADIDRAMAMGFNGARLHEKVFEERFLYHCDRKGYMVWGEFPNWNWDPKEPNATETLLPQWLEVVERDFNHPAIITWCPLNETQKDQRDEVIRTIYRTTKAIDPTRPCVDVSGYFHVETDIYDIHEYLHDAEALWENYSKMPFNITEPTERSQRKMGKQKYNGKLPLHISEFGGFTYLAEGKLWGYGSAFNTEEDLLDCFKKITDVFLNNPYICGFCYTQLTDVEQEKNGLYFYDRRPKIAPEKIRNILNRKAAIED